MIELSLIRTDDSVSASQISWFDWKFTTAGEPAARAQLIAGGYEPMLSTVNLAPGETVSGLVAFDTTARRLSAGHLARPPNLTGSDPHP
ncbi:MAG: hypothetical protein H0U15_09125 [Geodermatophilaceae bacterium]|nr:hypothetical protein [Geodermatophilaceae bacterium]